uniref:Uncharacterized protein n=1 Tax=Sander lucioperca TaxID=283035 RepID=A0A8C9Z9A8_SANLU
MESSPQDSASDPGSSGSESATLLTETPGRLETLRGEEHPTPARRHSSSSSSKGKPSAGFYIHINLSQS